MLVTCRRLCLCREWTTRRCCCCCCRRARIPSNSRRPGPAPAPHLRRIPSPALLPWWAHAVLCCCHGDPCIIGLSSCFVIICMPPVRLYLKKEREREKEAAAALGRECPQGSPGERWQENTHGGPMTFSPWQNASCLCFIRNNRASVSPLASEPTTMKRKECVMTPTDVVIIFRPVCFEIITSFVCLIPS